MQPYFETDLGKLYHGDCLEILPHFKFIDALITDPPFAFTGGISAGSSSVISDQFFRHWWKDIALLIHNVLKPEASGFIWCDWKTAKIISDGFEPKNQTYDYFRISQILYHHREMPGMGKPFRSSVDMIAYLRGPKHKNPPITADTLNFISEYWYYGKHKYHPSEKSLSMCERFLKWCTVENETVIDPFGGSGVVGVAAEKLDRQWIIIEIEETYCEIAAKRITAERQQIKLPGGF